MTRRVAQCGRDADELERVELLAAGVPCQDEPAGYIRGWLRAMRDHARAERTTAAQTLH